VDRPTSKPGLTGYTAQPRRRRTKPSARSGNGYAKATACYRTAPLHASLTPFLVKSAPLTARIGPRCAAHRLQCWRCWCVGVAVYSHCDLALRWHHRRKPVIFRTLASTRRWKGCKFLGYLRRETRDQREERGGRASVSICLRPLSALLFGGPIWRALHSPSFVPLRIWPGVLD
jgi:hypothetical protein